MTTSTAPGAQANTGKAIVLFSDGTGNSSAKLFKTNVWRMYEAVDLGPPAEGKRKQISYYDDGVGTSAFKPLALFGGAFGWGLKRNVLDIYRFACRNYQPGDEIYGFGFSRGAFTMRVAIALIASEGLVHSTNEAELLKRSREAYRRFRSKLLPRRLWWPTKAFRATRDWTTRVLDRVRGIPPYTPPPTDPPTIRFLGVWDTVAAYGGPIVEITRAIDNWVYPLSMPDYKLHPSVQRARHALAIDDERDAFQPLLWDEVYEAQLLAERRSKRDPVQELEDDRVLQVWFTGMHSDVGGGYPDESLSYVSLLWMMEEAEDAELRTLKTIKDRFVALASSAGPIHDSRKGLGAYYRYQPRKMAAWLQPVDDKTLSLRDPLIRNANGQAQGLLSCVKIHESVIARIASGTDRYAPITLPPCFEIVPPQVEGENVPQPDSETDGQNTRVENRPRPLIDAALRARLQDPVLRASRGVALEALWDFVWRRRVAYFVSLGFTLLLLSMPVWGDVWILPFLGDGRIWIGGVIRLVSVALPDFVDPWLDTYADHSLHFLILLAALLGTMRYSTACELKLRDRARRVWSQAMNVRGPAIESPEPTKLQRFRNSPKYQRGLQVFKWKVLPDFVFAPIIALATAWLLGAAATQTALPLLESRNDLCASAGQNLPPLTAKRLDFNTRATCQSVGALVTRGQTYRITFSVAEEWLDSNVSASPLGLAAGDLRLSFGYLGVPFRRVIKAKYLQPAIEIRHPRSVLGLSAVHIYPLDLAQDGEAQVVYRGEFKPAHGGELLLFANDAVPPFPFDIRYFYERSGNLFGGGPKGNSGTACVTVERTDLTAMPALAATSPACIAVDARAQASERAKASVNK